MSEYRMITLNFLSSVECCHEVFTVSLKIMTYMYNITGMLQEHKKMEQYSKENGMQSQKVLN